MDRQAPGHVQELVGSSSLRATPLDSRPGFFQRFRRKQETSKTEENKNAEFNRNQFTVETGNMNPEKIQFSPELQAQYATYLDNHLTRLAEVFNRDPHSPIFEAPEFRHQKLLLETLAEKTDAQYKVDKAKISEALRNDPELWITTTQIMEEDIALTLAGLGLTADINPGVFADKSSAFDTTVDAQRIYLDINRGRLNKLTGDHPMIANLALITAGMASTPQGIDMIKQGYQYLVTKMPQIDQFVQNLASAAQDPSKLAMWGTQYGGAALAGLAVVLGRKSFFEHGVTIDLNRNAKLISRLQSGRYPAEVQYLQDVIGLGVSDLSPTLLGGVARNEGLSNSIDMGKIQANLVSQLWTRFKFYNEGLGVPAEKVSMISEDLTFAQTGGNVRVDSTVWGKEVQDVRNQKVAEFINRAGHDPNSEELSMIDIESRREVIVRRLENRLVKQEPSKKTVSDLTSLADAVSTEEGKGRIITKRTEALKQAEAAIGAVEGTLTQEKNDTAAYVEAVNNVDKLREKARREYGVSTVAELQKLARERDVLSDADLATLRDELLAAEKAVENMEAKSLTIDRLHTAQEGQFTDLTTLDARLAAGGFAAVNLDANALANSTIEDILNKINLANTRSAGAEGWPKERNADHIKEIYQAIAEARARQIDPNVAISSRDLLIFSPAGAPAVAAAGGAAGLPPMAGVGLSNHEIMNLTAEEIAARVNNVHGGLLTLPADLNRIKAVKNEVRRKYDVRYQAWREVAADEQDIRTRQNNRVSSERSKIDSEIQKLETERDAMRREETEVAAFKNDQKIANELMDGPEVAAYHKGWQQFETYHAFLSALRPPQNDLDPRNLHRKTVDQIMRDINRIHGTNPNIGWPATQNSDHEHIRSIVAAKAESQAQQNSDMTTPVGSMANLLTAGFREEELARIDLGKIAVVMREMVAAGVPAATIGTDAQFRAAVEQAKRRHDLRKQMLGRTITAAKAVGGSFANTDVDFLQLDPEFQKAYKALEQHKSRLSTPAAPVTGSADLDARIVTRTDERNALQEYPDLSDYLNNITENTYKEYIEASTKLDTKRAETASKATGAETSAQLQTKIEDRAKFTKENVEQAATELKTALDAIEASGDAAQKAATVRENIESAYKDVLGIDRKLRRIVGAGAIVGLNMTDLINTNYDELLRRINTAHGRSVAAGMTPPVGWPKEQNDIPANREMLVNAITGARFEQTRGTLLRPAPDAREILSNLSVDQALAMTEVELQAESLRWRTAAGVAAPAAMTLTEVQNAQKVLKQVVEAQRNTIQSTIDANARRRQELALEIKNVTGSYDNARTFISAVTDMTKKQGEVYGRIPQLMGSARNIDFTQGIPPGSRDFTEVEQNPTINGVAVPNLPKGYYDILHMITGYQDNVKEGRDVVFEKLINVPQFHPNELAQTLNRRLNLVVGPVRIEEIVEEIRTRVNNKTLNQSDVFHAIRGMRDEYIAQVKAIS